VSWLREMDDLRRSQLFPLLKPAEHNPAMTPERSNSAYTFPSSLLRSPYHLGPDPSPDRDRLAHSVRRLAAKCCSACLLVLELLSQRPAEYT
jgi:hypothetical protein